MRFGRNTLALMFFTALGSVSAHAWPGSGDFANHYDNAVLALINHKAYNVETAASSYVSPSGVARAFAIVTSPSEIGEFASELVRRVTEESEGKVKLEAITAAETTVQAEDALQYFRMTRYSNRGQRIVEYVVLSRNGLQLYQRGR
jgi:hypothetical protein